MDGPQPGTAPHRKQFERAVDPPEMYCTGNRNKNKSFLIKQSTEDKDNEGNPVNDLSNRLIQMTKSEDATPAVPFTSHRIQTFTGKKRTVFNSKLMVGRIFPG